MHVWRRESFKRRLDIFRGLPAKWMCPCHQNLENSSRLIYFLHDAYLIHLLYQTIQSLEYLADGIKLHPQNSQHYDYLCYVDKNISALIIF